MQMQEKVMVADTLASINSELTRYAGMIVQSENQELKQQEENILPLLMVMTGLMKIGMKKPKG